MTNRQTRLDKPGRPGIGEEGSKYIVFVSDISNNCAQIKGQTPLSGRDHREQCYITSGSGSLPAVAGATERRRPLTLVTGQ